MVGLVDTSIIIDMLRGNTLALTWLQTAGQLGVSRSVVLETLQGATSIAHQQNAITLINQWELMELTVSDFVWATDELLRLRLHHGVGAFDCLIAAPSYRLRLPLYTLNVRHFTPLIGKLAQKPY